MNKKCYSTLLVFFFFISPFCDSQNAINDSLLHVFNTTKQDTIKVKALNELFLENEFVDDQKANEYLIKALEISKKAKDEKGLATTYFHLGFLSEDRGDYPVALNYYSMALEIKKKVGTKNEIAGCINNIGNVFYYQGNYPEALLKYFAALKIREEISDKQGIANSHITIGNVYCNQGNYKMSLDNFNAALKQFQEVCASSVDVTCQKGIASCYNNIGIVNKDQGNYPEALKNYSLSIKLMEALNDPSGIADAYNNIGAVYADQAELEKDLTKRMAIYNDALKNYFVSLKIEEEIDSKAGITSTYTNIGNVLAKQKKYSEAKVYLNKAIVLSKEIGYKEFLQETYAVLSITDSACGDFKGAYENHKLYILYKDSLDNEETRKKTIQSQMTFDFEKKEAVATAEHKKELENQQLLANEKSRRQNIVLVLVLGSLLLVLVFAGFIARSLRITRKQKDLIQKQKNLVEQQKMEVEWQKNLVEEKQKEILDSINYARRIQSSLMPTEKYIERSLGRLMCSTNKRDK